MTPLDLLAWVSSIVGSGIVIVLFGVLVVAASRALNKTKNK